MSANTPDEMSELRRHSTERAQARQDGEERMRSLLLGVAAVVLIGALVAAVIIFQGGGGGTVGVVKHPPRATATSHGVALGPTSAPVQVVVYEDFHDTASARFEMGSRDYLHTDAAAGRVHVEYRPLALSGADSARMVNAFADVLDVAGPGAAWRFHDLVFDRTATGQPSPTDTQLIALAVRAGAKESAVRTGLSSKRQRAHDADAAAARDGVRHAPTVLVDGSRMQGTVDQVVDQLETRIAKED